jgi:hypothetical protein
MRSRAARCRSPCRSLVGPSGREGVRLGSAAPLVSTPRRSSCPSSSARCRGGAGPPDPQACCLAAGGGLGLGGAVAEGSGMGGPRKGIFVTGCLPRRSLRNCCSFPAHAGRPGQTRDSPTAKVSAYAPQLSHQVVPSERNRMCPTPSVPPPTLCPLASARRLARAAHLSAAAPLQMPRATRRHVFDLVRHTSHFQPAAVLVRRWPPRIMGRAVMGAGRGRARRSLWRRRLQPPSGWASRLG